MPNYFAHLEFGRYVLEALPLPLRREVEREKDAFLLGLYGPDPLMFHCLPTGKRVRAAGQEIHRQSVRVAAERLRLAVEEGLPGARGYAAGFLCHFALDSACHPYVEEAARGGVLTHGQIEAELDRHLMLRVGLEPLRDTPMPPLEVAVELEGVLRAVYSGVSPRQFRCGYDMFCRASRLLTLASGTRLGGVAERMAQAHAKLSGLRGVVLPREPEQPCVESSGTLRARLFSAVDATAGELEGYFSAVERGSELSPWFDRDFHGRRAEGHPEDALSPAPAPAGC